MVVRYLPKLKHFGFYHENPEVFAMSQWQTSTKSIFYLIYRWIIAIFFVGTLAYSMTDSVAASEMEYWFIYMTNIGLFICMLASIYGAIFVSLYHFSLIHIESSSINYKLYWFLTNVAIVLAFVITIVYWATLFDWSTGVLTILDFLVHAANSIAMIVELLVVLHPMYFSHVIYSIFVGLLYLIFTIIYFFAGGTDAMGNDFIYSILNWNNAGRTSLIVLGVVALAIVMHGCACLIQFGRIKAHRWISRNRIGTLDISKPV